MTLLVIGLFATLIGAIASSLDTRDNYSSPKVLIIVGLFLAAYGFMSLTPVIPGIG